MEADPCSRIFLHCDLQISLSFRRTFAGFCEPRCLYRPTNNSVKGGAKLPAENAVYVCRKGRLLRRSGCCIWYSDEQVHTPKVGHSLPVDIVTPGHLPCPRTTIYQTSSLSRTLCPLPRTSPLSLNCILQFNQSINQSINQSEIF